MLVTNRKYTFLLSCPFIHGSLPTDEFSGLRISLIFLYNETKEGWLRQLIAEENKLFKSYADWQLKIKANMLDPIKLYEGNIRWIQSTKYTLFNLIKPGSTFSFLKQTSWRHLLRIQDCIEYLTENRNKMFI